MGTHRGRRALVCALATIAGAFVSAPAPAGAAPAHMSAADFIAKCTDPPYTVTQDTVVTGRAEVASDACQAEVASGVSFTMRDVTIRVAPGFEPGPDGGTAFLSVKGNDGTQIDVQRTRITITNEIQFGTGQSAGGRVHVVNSVLRSEIGGVTLESATHGTGGEVVVTDSTLAGPAGVVLQASCASDNCRTSPSPSSGGTAIARRTTVPVGSLTVWTGTSGRTVATDNTVRSRELNLHAGAGGTCVSRRNVPDVPCTPPPGPGVPDDE